MWEAYRDRSYCSLSLISIRRSAKLKTARRGWMRGGGRKKTDIFQGHDVAPLFLTFLIYCLPPFCCHWSACISYVVVWLWNINLQDYYSDVDLSCMFLLRPPPLSLLVCLVSEVYLTWWVQNICMFGFNRWVQGNSLHFGTYAHLFKS